MKQKLIVLQEGSKDCGAAALLSIIRYYGGDVSLDRLIDLTKTTKEGTNFYNIKEAANKIGLIGTGYRVEDILKLRELNEPFIAQIRIDSYFHFVVVYKMNDNKMLIMDPAKGRIEIDVFDFSNSFTGNIMLFEKKGDALVLKSSKEITKILFSSIINNRYCILFVFILSIIFTSLSCLISLYSKFVFDNVIDTNTNNLLIITIIFSILIIIKNITSFIRNYLIIYLNQKLDISMVLSTFAKIILLPYKYYKNKTTSEVLSRISDLFSVKNFISKVVMIILVDNLLFIVASIIICNINIKIFLLLIIMTFTYCFMIVVFNPIIKNITLRKQEDMAKINSLIIEDVSSFETVKGLNIEDNVIYDFDSVYNSFLNNVFYGERINNIIVFIKILIEDIGLLIISYFGIKFVMYDSLSTGDYFTVMLFANYIISPGKNILSILNEYHYINNSIRRVNNLLNNSIENIEDADNLMVNGDIVIKNLSYTYNNKYNILNNVNFFIRNGEKVVIIGSSGSGKSTLLKLIYKYLDCGRDSIFINNYDINDFSLNDIRSNIVYISQNEMLYTKTIRDNILLGRNIDKSEYLNVINMCYVNDIIKDNPLGDNFMLEENGVNISGGQRQRIILARGLLKNSNVIMIDEGFNQIDINLERKILKNLFYYYKDKTIIVISHRKENIDLYDRMIKFSNGKVINLERRRCDE